MFSECIRFTVIDILVLFVAFLCTSGFKIRYNMQIQINFELLTTDYDEKDGEWWCTSNFRDESKRKVSKGHLKCLDLIAQNFTDDTQATGFTTPNTTSLLHVGNIMNPHQNLKIVNDILLAT